VSLAKSMDAGRTWSGVSLPKPLVRLAERRVLGSPAILYSVTNGDGTPSLNVRFANARDGWIYGSVPVPAKVNGSPSVNFQPVFWSTHDAGLTWKAQPHSWFYSYSETPILDLEATSSTVYLMALNKSFGVTLESSPVAHDHWRVALTKGLLTPAGGGPLEGAIFFSGSKGWLVEGNDRGVTGSAQLNSAGRWVAWTPPCESVGNSYFAPVASTPSHLLVECVMGGYASPLSSTAPSGATIGSTWLYTSENAGRTFTARTELARNNVYFGPVLASPKATTILLTRNIAPRQELVASFDAGHHWTAVYFASVYFARFVSTSEGVALVRPSKGPNQLIMTFDGGQHWFPVPF